jgi:hypothetical protein
MTSAIPFLLVAASTWAASRELGNAAARYREALSDAQHQRPRRQLRLRMAAVMAAQQAVTIAAVAAHAGPPWWIAAAACLAGALAGQASVERLVWDGPSENHRRTAGPWDGRGDGGSTTEGGRRGSDPVRG